MTTKIIIDTHAGWSVKVEAIDSFLCKEPIVTTIAIVPPNTIQEFHVWDYRELLITELRENAMDQS